MSPCASQPSARRPLPAALGDVPCCSSSPRARPPLPAAVRGSDVKADSFQTLCCVGRAGPERRLHKHPAVTCRPPTRAHRELPDPPGGVPSLGGPGGSGAGEWLGRSALPSVFRSGDARALESHRGVRPRRPGLAVLTARGRGFTHGFGSPPGSRESSPRPRPDKDVALCWEVWPGDVPVPRGGDREDKAPHRGPTSDSALVVAARRFREPVGDAHAPSPCPRSPSRRARRPLARRKPALAPGRPEPLAVSVGVTE